MYHRWGPNARHCVALGSGDKGAERSHARIVANAAREFTISLPVVAVGVKLATVAGSYKLFCVRPRPGGKGRGPGQSTVMSPHVQLIIQDAVSRVEHEKKKSFYTLVSDHPHCRSVMGALLKQQFHRWIGLAAELPSPGPNDFRECMPRAQKKTVPVLRLRPTRKEPLNDITDLARAESLTPPIYYSPTSELFESVDGLILTTDTVILIQVTVSWRHALKKQCLVELYNHLPVSIRSKSWKFVWVVPEDDVGKRLVGRKFDVSGDWHHIEFYWCRFPFDTSVSFRIRFRRGC